MLDLSIVGAQIARLRKLNGYTQDKLALLMHVSPQAVSKWENGHTLPEASLLPVLSDIFKCTIDQILMPAYTTDESLVNERNNMIEIQAGRLSLSSLTGMCLRSLRRKTLRGQSSTVTVSWRSIMGE